MQISVLNERDYFLICLQINDRRKMRIDACIRAVRNACSVDPVKALGAMKTYRGDLIKLKKKLENREAFAFSRYGEGELRILMVSSRNAPNSSMTLRTPQTYFPRRDCLTLSDIKA